MPDRDSKRWVRHGSMTQSAYWRCCRTLLRARQYESMLVTLSESPDQPQTPSVPMRSIIETSASYERVFDAIVSEQNELKILYEPLMRRLAETSGTLRKLSFSVSRVVDANAWANTAEDELIDCRKAGPFYGRGSLIKLADSELKPAWETGSAADVRASMTRFIAKYSKDLLNHAPYVPTQKQEFRAWSRRFAQWLFNTDHISVRYEITYDGVDTGVH